jgi:signal transduction histidine kinase
MLLINEVLDLSKIESGNIDVDFERVHLDDVIAESISIIKPRANLKNIEIIDNVSCNGHYVKADEKRLKQVLVNLLSNAEKYNSINGKIIIDCEYVNDIYLRIKITDSGNGIDEKDFDKLFMPFERLDKRNNIEGTGIGLVVTKRLVQLMCGTIGVESKTGEGSTFWIQFELDESVG